MILYIQGRITLFKKKKDVVEEIVKPVEDTQPREVIKEIIKETVRVETPPSHQELKIKTKEFIPEYKDAGAVGFDLRAYLPQYKDKPFRFSAGQRVLIPTGIQMEIPEGYEVQIRPRSGLSLKEGITAILGTIDYSYRGDVGILLINHSDKAFYIKHGDRIAQGVLSPITKAVFKVTAELSKTERGEGGFGSTGVQ